jgi:leucyl-tRNA synthetase
MINYPEMEKKWQKVWEDLKVYEADPDNRPALLVTAALPYVNMPQHIGHLRTYSTADLLARYMRAKGFNVLYPMAFHKTGTPILAIAKRITSRDEDLIKELKMYDVDDESISKMVDPLYIADYFATVMERGMRRAGYGIDWRRKFDTIQPMFSKLVEWQFFKLKEKRLLSQGTHPVGWCTNENNAVGQHDTKGDVQPEIDEETVIKFKDVDSDIYFACATLRPETIYGVTNIFVDPKARYVIANIEGERYYLSKNAASTLSYQKKISVESELIGDELLKKRALNPITGDALPVLPGFFVKDETGTGVVMSVPAHAPFDYAALERLKVERYSMPELNYKKVIEVKPGSEAKSGEEINREIPALGYLELLNADPNAPDDVLERATKALYKEESHRGIMIEGPYKGAREPEAREKIKLDMLREGKAFSIYALSNESPIYCRCGQKVIVKTIENQWFINYGDEAWKEKTRKLVGNMKFYPGKLKEDFGMLVDWIDLRATERAQGLGTRFPFNPDHIIESLSDSTMYMTFYTFDYILFANSVKPEQLKPAFFDYLFDYTNDIGKVSGDTGISEEAIKKCKESIDYWYTNTDRHSAPDLIPNHLTMYLFIHTALLPERFLPKQIVVNGFVNSEGVKMSKSFGNIVPLLQGAERYGADPLRFIEVTGADLDTDTNFSVEALNGVYSRNEFLYNTVMSLGGMQSGELKHIDYWLYSVLNRKIREVTALLDEMSLRNAYTGIYYNSVSELQWYLERGGNNALVMHDFLERIVLMLSIIMPHFSEELWHMLGKSTLVVKEQWPKVDDDMINPVEEESENVIRNTIYDVRQGMELSSKIDANRGRKVKEVKIIVAEPWKAEAYNILAEKKDIGAVMGDPAMGKIDKERLSKFLSQFAKRINALSRLNAISDEALMNGFADSKEFMEKKIGSGVKLEKEAESKSARAARALPNKPSIEIVWE